MHVRGIDLTTSAPFILRRMRSTARLLAAAHPVPSAAVTALATAVSAAAGRSWSGCILVATTVLSGQLSIGWSNDLLDRTRDKVSGRHDKPLATGALRVGAVTAACALALVATVPLSLANGLAAGTAHLLGVAGGWAYNLGLKRTWASFLPYAVSFGLLTAFVTLGLPGAPSPAPWVVTAGALLGVGAHFLNVVPDVPSDLAAGVRGLPQRLGQTRAAVTGAVLLATAAGVTVVGPGDAVPAWGWAGLAIAGCAAVLAGASGLRPRPGRAPFLLGVLTAAVTVGLLVARGTALT